MINSDKPKITPNKPEHPNEKPGPENPSIPRRIPTPPDAPDRTPIEAPPKDPEEVPVKDPQDPRKKPPKA